MDKDLEILEMMMAIKKVDNQKVKGMLDAGMDPNFIHENQMINTSPLEIAAMVGNLEAAEILFKCGARPNICHAFNHAVWSGNKEMVALFLKYGIDPNMTMNSGYSPIDCAIRDGYVGVVKVLLENGANPNKGMYEGSPLENAIKRARDNEDEACEMIRLLLSHGAKFGRIKVD